MKNVKTESHAQGCDTESGRKNYTMDSALNHEQPNSPRKPNKHFQTMNQKYLKKH